MSLGRFVAAIGFLVSMFAPAVQAAPPELNRIDLEIFLDGFMPYALQRGDIAGGVVAVVKDGKPLFAKAYGYANLARREKVTPEGTLFRLASISKLFTWTAVMQQVEQGKLDLDRDVETYLDFKLDPAFGKVTLRQLMTHTAGFEDTSKDHQRPIDEPGLSLGTFVKTHVPAQIFPPGTTIAYSNYGVALAGYLVERVSGEPFETYVAAHIFQPLGMESSSFAQPLPPALAARMATGYATASDGAEQKFERITTVPSGAMVSSAADMQRFMLAQLQGGAQLLKPETVRQMQAQNYVPAPGMNGFTLGFGEESRNGQRIIGHGGTLDFFRTDLFLLPEAGVGVFVALNSAGGEGAAHAVLSGLQQAFLDRYFPAPLPDEPTFASAVADAARVAGWYLPTRRIESALRLSQLLMQSDVRAHVDGTIETAGLKTFAGTPKRWHEIGQLTYREIGGRSRLVFVADPDGRIRYWTTDDFPPVMLFQRVEGLRAQGKVLLLLPAALLVLLVAVIRMRTRGRRLGAVARVGVVAMLVSVVGWFVLLLHLVADETRLSDAALPWMNLLYALSALALLGAVATIVWAVRCWIEPARLPARIGAGLTGLAAAYAGWFILAYGLANFSSRF